MQRNGYKYKFTYNDFNQIIGVNVGVYDYVDLEYIQGFYNGKTYQTGLIKKQTFGNGYYFEFAYNDENQIQSIIFNGEEKPRFEYEYDASGRLTILKDIHNSNIFFYSYDLAGRPIKITDKDGNDIKYAYDAYGNLETYYYDIKGKSRGVHYVYNYDTGKYNYTQYTASGKNIKQMYEYDVDSLQRLWRMKLVIGTGLSFGKEIKYYSDTPGDPNIVTNGTSSNRIYQIVYQKNDSMQKTHQFTYDENNNIIEISVGIPGVGELEKYQYSYDGFNQLIRENIKINENSYSRTFTYTYNHQGNVTSIKEYAYTTGTLGSVLKEKRMFYENIYWGDQLTKIEYYNGTTLSHYEKFTYDAIGNVTKIEDSRYLYATNFEWDGRNLARKSGYMYAVFFKYNDQGVRVDNKKSGIGAYQYTYVVDGYNVLVETRGADTIYYTYNADGTLLSMNYQNQEYFYITNLQGDIIELVDINGNVIAKYRYDALGNIVYQYDNGSNIDDINPYRYRSYRYDANLGWYYLQSRYYNPTTGRFINADNISYLDSDAVTGFNLYTYAGNNPVMYLDSTGTSPEWWNPFSWTNEIWEKVAITAVIVVGVIALSVLTAGIGGAVTSALGGGFWAAVAGGAAGGAVSGAIFGGGFSLISQGIANGYDNIDWGKVGIDTLIGAGSGALMGAAFAAAGRGLGLLGKTKWAQRQFPNWTYDSKHVMFGSKSGNFTLFRNGHTFRIEASIQKGLHYHGYLQPALRMIFEMRNHASGLIPAIINQL